MLVLNINLHQQCVATQKVLGESPKIESSQKWLGEGQKDFFGPRTPKASCTGANRVAQGSHIARNCNTIAAIPHIARSFFRTVSSSPKWCDTALVSHRHICAIPHFATDRPISVRYPTKTSSREFCDTIATSISRYEKYRCWSSKQSCTSAKQGLGGARDFWGDLCSLGPKHLLHPLTTTLGTFEAPGSRPL